MKDCEWFVTEKHNGTEGHFGPFNSLQGALDFVASALFPWSDEVLDSIEIVKVL